MALPGKPLKWSPKGASDTLDASTAPTGAMALLQDLIPDPTTRDLWQCRPAATKLVDFTGGGFSTGFSSGFSVNSFLNPTFISCMKVIGTRIYGMVSTSRFAGHDEPFVYDIPSATFVPITGVTLANTPASPATSGPWTPPNLDLISTKIIVAHPGFTGAGGAFFGVLDVSNPAAPTWTATNTTVNALVSPPVWVVNFNGRCYFLCNPAGQQSGAYMSDQINPTVITNGNQILTFGDNLPLTCAAGLPLENQLGGIIQSLMVFKGATNIYQVTGDPALSNLTVNSLNVATGTLAPLSIATTTAGLAFIATDGLRVITFDARVSDPIGQQGDGITVPFINALTPSRMAAAYNNGVYRVQVENGVASGNPKQQQWWFDFVKKVWSGPHSQAASLLEPYLGSFIVTLQNAGAQLWQSDVVQSSSSSFVENGQQLSWTWATPMLPDTDEMSEVAMIESTINMALVAGVQTVSVNAADQNGAVFDQIQITPAGATTIWGAFTWGQALWQGTLNALAPRQLPWHYPIVFRRMGITATGISSPGVKIGTLFMRYQILGYLQQ